MVRAVMGPRWWERVWSGTLASRVDEKERREERDQTWMLESAEPERRCVEVGEMAR